MMNKIPRPIADFITQHHVVSLACSADDITWAASCFYIFEPENNRLIILTKATTRHGELMLKNPNIAGTIAGQPSHIRDIEGIQFTATARRLVDEEKKYALARYHQHYAIAKMIPSDVWEICFNEIKHTANRIAFAHKTQWQRTPT